MGPTVGSPVRRSDGPCTGRGNVAIRMSVGRTRDQARPDTDKADHGSGLATKRRARKVVATVTELCVSGKRCLRLSKGLAIRLTASMEAR